MRSQAAALLLFFANIANLVVAPQLVGVVSDALAPRFGAESLRLALLPLTLCGGVSATASLLDPRHEPLEAGVQQQQKAATDGAPFKNFEEQRRQRR
jgi:hypothetical protein